MSTTATRQRPSPPEETLEINATDVTGNQTRKVRVHASLPAETVAQSLASMLSLPDNVTWAMRDDRSSVYLDDTLPIGSQLEPGSRVTLSPKTHLG